MSPQLVRVGRWLLQTGLVSPGAVTVGRSVARPFGGVVQGLGQVWRVAVPPVVVVVIVVIFIVTMAIGRARSDQRAFQLERQAQSLEVRRGKVGHGLSQHDREDARSAQAT